MNFKFSNDASAIVAVAVSPSANTITLQSGGGSKFPILLTGEIARAALVSTLATEYVTITGISGDVATVERAKEGTAANSFAIGSRFELRMTAEVEENFLQKSGGTLSGDIDFAGHRATNLQLDTSVGIQFVHSTLLRASDVPFDTPYDAVVEPAIYFPPAYGLPRMSGRVLLHTGYFNQIIFDIFVALNDVPIHWKLCDGNNGTPDLRGIFIRGWSDTEQPGVRGGNYVIDTDPGGGFAGVNTNDVGLNGSNLPGIFITQDIALNTGTDGTGQRVRTITGFGYNAGSPVHHHTVPGQPPHAHRISNLQPPYICVAKVMFNFDLV